MCTPIMDRNRQRGKIDRSVFAIRDDISSSVDIVMLIKRVENDLLEPVSLPIKKFADLKVKTNETSNPWSGVTKTTVYLYGSGNKGGLLVTEDKSKSYKRTLTHYHAAASGNVFSQSRIDIGLSIVLNIRVSNNGLDFTMEDPASALIYMFEQVSRTGTWKPTACPHCDKIQRQSNGMSWQSESEDSDSLPPTRLHGSGQNARSVLANNGVLRGR